MKLRSRVISMLLAFCMLLSMLPPQPITAVTGTTPENAISGSTISISLTDSYGDGWNGNKIEVYIDGVYSTSYTISQGYSAFYTLAYDNTKNYEFKWVKSSYSSECSFEIVLEDTTLLKAARDDCNLYTNGQQLLFIEAIFLDWEGEFAGGSGTVSDPYLVATKQQLNNVRNYKDVYFRQVAHISFTESDFAEGGEFYNDGQGWEPIGNQLRPFEGYYDGNGYSITGLTINRTSDETYSYVGLFGLAYYDIVNVTLNDICYTVNATKNGYVGGVVGYCYENVIGCSVSGEMNVANYCTGGVAGYAYYVKHCTNDATINDSGRYYVDIGGIVGIAYTVDYCQNYGSITSTSTDPSLAGIACVAYTRISNCENHGNITANSTADDSYLVLGGIASRAQCTITKCENSGSIAGTGYYASVGGIAGQMIYTSTPFEITECVNKGAVSARSNSSITMNTGMVGGIVGEMESGTIRDCYATAGYTPTASGSYTSTAGGIAGYVWDDSCVITNCYSVVSNVSVNTNSQSWGRGGIAGISYGQIDNCACYYTYTVGYNGGTAYVNRVSTLSNFAKQSTYSGFDFNSIWVMGTDGYTYAILRMESPHDHTISYQAPTVTHEASGLLEHWYCAGCESYFRDFGTMYSTEDMLTSDPLPRTGTCGDNVFWSLSFEGVLTIYGEGDMDNISVDGHAPWYDYKENIKQVIVEDGVCSIGDYAFADCAVLEKVSLPESLSTIGHDAFNGCAKLPYLIIPAHVTFIGDQCFIGTTDLILCFTGGAPLFEGVNIFVNTDTSIYYPAGDDSWTEDVMDPVLTNVTWYAYENLDDVILKSGRGSSMTWSVSITGLLTITGDYNGVTMPDYYYTSNRLAPWAAYKEFITAVKCVRMANIGAYAFYEYPALKYVDLGNANVIGQSAFYQCNALEGVFIEGQTNKASIATYAFYHCDNLKWVSFPHQSSIGSYAFAFCNQLQNIYVGTLSKLNLSDSYYGLTIASDSFKNVVGTVCLPYGSNVQDYGDFGGDLTWSVTKSGPCGANAFWSFDEDTQTITITGTGKTVYYRSGTYYPWYDLRDSVKHVVFEDGITELSEYLFEYMSSIETVTLPNTLTYMVCNAFNDCIKLNNLLIPASVKEFDSYGHFNRCDALTDLYYLGTAEQWAQIENTSVVGGSYDNISTIHFLQLHEQKPTCTEDGIAPYYRFENTSVYSDYYDLSKNVIDGPQVAPATGHNYEGGICTNCDEVGGSSIANGTCGDTVYWLLLEGGTLVIYGEGTLAGDPGSWEELKDLITAVQIQNGITTLGDSCFASLDQITELTIPASVGNIGFFVFDQSDALHTITFTGDAPVFQSHLGKTLTVYYPGDNSTWSAVTSDDHHGFVTWIPYCIGEHDWMAATCLAPETCAVCGQIRGEAMAHNIVNCVCILCGSAFHTYESGVCGCGHYQVAEGMGTEEEPYLICNAGNLFWFASIVNSENPSACGLVTNDITVPGGMSWTPIGTGRYYGTFDGGNHTISGLYYSGDAYFAGLFGKLESATVKNVRLQGCSFETSSTVFGYAGGIAGFMMNGYSGSGDCNITNCYVSNINVSGDYAGALVGVAENYCDITDCHSNGGNTICGEYGAGGILGQLHQGGSVEGCTADATVTGKYCGGIVGMVQNDAGPYVNRTNLVERCVAYGSVGSISSQYSGGIVGYVSATTDALIRFCASQAYVQAEANEYGYAGGLLGYCYGDYERDITIQYSYSLSSVSGFRAAALSCGSYVWLERCYTNNSSLSLTVSGSITDCECMSDEQFASGEVAYLLREGTSAPFWGQVLGMELYPTLGGPAVYYGYDSCAEDASMVYSNNLLCDEKPDHSYTDDMDSSCNVCGHMRDVHTCHGQIVYGQSATCEENGWVDYYQCTCGKYYADPECTDEIINLEEWRATAGMIPATDHTPGSQVEENHFYSESIYYCELASYCTVCGTECSREMIKLYMLGDVDGDGKVNVLDAMLTAQYAVGHDVQINAPAAEVTGDGVINVLDAMTIAQFVVGIVDHFEKEDAYHPWGSGTWTANVYTNNKEYVRVYTIDASERKDYSDFGLSSGYDLVQLEGKRYDTLTEEEKQEYIPMYVDGVLYGNDNGGVDFIDYVVEGDTVTFTDLDHNPLVVLTRVSGNQYQVTAYRNQNQNHYLHRSLPIGTVFTFVEG